MIITLLYGTALNSKMHMKPSVKKHYPTPQIEVKKNDQQLERV